MTSPLSVVPPTTSPLSVVPPTTSPPSVVPPTTLRVVPSFCHCRNRCHSGKSCPCKKLKVLCTVQCHPGHTCTNCKTSLAVEGSVDLTRKDPQKTILKPSLSSEQKRILFSKAWLDDTVIDKGQALLKAQYPHISGLQSVILTEKYALIPQPDEFLQILNVNGNHWILLSTIGCPPATINVYDSLHGNLSPPAQRVVADLLQCKEANITIRYMDVQWQSNGYDCGLFALANATALCAGIDPTSVTFEQSKMRKHFLECLERNCLVPFPIRGQRRHVSPARIDKFSIYCVCRLTDTGSQMIQCNHCNEWFHTNCVIVARKYLKNIGLTWLCGSCKN